VIEKAKDYLDQDEIRLNKLIEKLNRIIKETEDHMKEAIRAKEKHINALRRASRKIAQVEMRKRQEIERFRFQAQASLEKAREEIRALINEFKRGGPSVMDSVKKRYHDICDELERNFPRTSGKDNGKSVKELTQGQRVRHTVTGRMGEVILIDRAHSRAVIRAGSIKVVIPFSELEPVDEGAEKSLKDGNLNKDYYFTPQTGLKNRDLNIVGLRVHDALSRIEKALDQAILDGTSCLRIIHGHGAGILRRAVREHLRSNPYVKSISSAEPHMGGDAITLVELE
jgi:DNA mismatch repair protein MutS2